MQGWFHVLGGNDLNHLIIEEGLAQKDAPFNWASMSYERRSRWADSVGLFSSKAARSHFARVEAAS
jgi:hypothetical protein